MLFLRQTSDKTEKQSRLKKTVKVLSESFFEGRYSEMSSEDFGVAARVIPGACPKGHAPVVIYISKGI